MPTPPAAAAAARAASCSPSVDSSSGVTDPDGDSIIHDVAAEEGDAVHDEGSTELEYAAVPTPAGRKTATTSSSSASSRVQPSGPICSFGPRLAYTYFKSPAPRSEILNSLTAAAESRDADPGAIYWFSIDDQLVYLSFFQDYGPLNVGCL